jgi:uncharacterized protein YjiS (DUF1127 family)
VSEIAMNAQIQRSIAVASLLFLSVILSAGARHVRRFAKALGTWLERRRARSAGLRELRSMSDRELKDLGIGRSDIEGIARDVRWDRDRFRI